VLTRSWGHQLLEMLPVAVQSASPIAAILESSNMILTWRNLESVEEGLLHSGYVGESI